MAAQMNYRLKPSAKSRQGAIIALMRAQRAKEIMNAFQKVSVEPKNKRYELLHFEEWQGH